MEINKKDYGHRVLSINTIGDAPFVDVPAYSIPSILETMSWTKIGLLKVDIEGHEKNLFSGDCTWLNRVEALCVEWHYDDAEECLVELSRRFNFEPPILLPGLWLLTRRSELRC